MPPRTHAKGRHGGARRSLRGELAVTLSQSGVIKLAAGGGLVAAVAASVAVPAIEDTGITTQAAPNVAFAIPRDAGTQAASRTTERLPLGVDGLLTPSTDIAASAPAAPLATDGQAVSGITAEAKPVEVAPVEAAPVTAAATPSAIAGVTATAGLDTSSYAGAGAALGLGYNAQGVYSAIVAQFGQLNMGGYRAGDSGDHGAGRAVDVMVDSATGDAVAAFLQAHAGELNINYLIWQQRIWYPGGGWQWMADRGSITENHYDHVHISVY